MLSLFLSICFLKKEEPKRILLDLFSFLKCLSMKISLLLQDWGVQQKSPCVITMNPYLQHRLYWLWPLRTIQVCLTCCCFALSILVTHSTYLALDRKPSLPTLPFPPAFLDISQLNRDNRELELILYHKIIYVNPLDCQADCACLDVYELLMFNISGVCISHCGSGRSSNLYGCVLSSRRLFL